MTELYPVYASLKAYRTKIGIQDWLKYWSLRSFYVLACYLLYPLLDYMSVYSIIESVCPVLLLLFSTKIFDSLLVPILSGNESEIDSFLTKSTRVGLQLVRGFFNRVKKMVMREVSEMLTNPEE
mmetsp:Transcript_26743/g.48191  ORF Transcript_26743/g.48191 Transcript_26743/m.48191 type:complete len:124 (-) Transcript_26743:2242-2613(-)|eukprot:CAMPEP_0204918778 /NCGR_PEP_ID=MMETSP1397-20131031/16407_1 /ASSEMBLY_ACC=CAM_ASM_000891 /TAXON_ID=49980 /ORGANISM="Climacostomum Climacostomum virens, Strain Stock W-24" /LENGTH=123 /DNA_ID=CAMNT_0052092219 /DNA_START=111 /DNA_END=482 /DNA_ORIENTATION=-